MTDMSTETKPNRHLAGSAAGGGRFAAKDRAAGDVNLWDVASAEPAPSPDQFERAQVEAERRAKNHGYTAAETEDATERIARRLAAQEAAYEAFQRGEPHTDDSGYAAVWAGDGPGVSEQMARAELAKTIAQRELFDDGRLSPSDILPGYRANARAAAEAHLDEKEAMYSIALDCGGRNLSVNQTVVVNNRLQAEAELLGAPF